MLKHGRLNIVSITAATDVTVLGFFSDPQQRVLSVWGDGKGEPLVVSRNLSSGQHSIWSVQRATPNVSIPL